MVLHPTCSVAQSALHNLQNEAFRILTTQPLALVLDLPLTSVLIPLPGQALDYGIGCITVSILV